MAFPAAMRTMAGLVASAEALAALGARLRADAEGMTLDPEIEAVLDGVLAELGISIASLEPSERATVALFARAFLHQATHLIDHPEHPPGWAYEDEVVLLSQGRGSAVVAAAFAETEVLNEALSRPGAALLDVGAGVGSLSVAFCEHWPGLRVVGLEPWEFALAHARGTVAGFEDRIELREGRVEELDDVEAFDAAWLPTPFLSPAIVPAALERVFAALKPGGLVVFALYAAPPDALSQQLVGLRTLRSGGRLWPDPQATVAAAGFTGVRELERTWAAPIRLVVGTRG